MEEETYAARTEATTSPPGSARGAYGGSWKTVSQSRAAISSRIAPAGVGVQVVPDQDERAAELLVRGVQEPGVVLLGEPLALIARAGRRCVRKISRGPQPGRTAISAASDTRVSWPPVTVTTGVWPRRPQVRPFGGLRPWPDSSSQQSQAPRSAAVLL